jgi:hypothetical protein
MTSGDTYGVMVPTLFFMLPTLSFHHNFAWLLFASQKDVMSHLFRPHSSFQLVVSVSVVSLWIYSEFRWVDLSFVHWYILCSLIWSHNLFATIRKIFIHTIVWNKAQTYQKKIQFPWIMGSYIFSRSLYLMYFQVCN